MKRAAESPPPIEGRSKRGRYQRVVELADDNWREIAVHLEGLREWLALAGTCWAIRDAVYSARDLVARLPKAAYARAPPALSLPWVFGARDDAPFYAHLRTLVLPKEGAWIAGGAARAWVLNALRATMEGHRRPARELSAAFDDIDVWLDPDVLDTAQMLAMIKPDGTQWSMLADHILVGMRSPSGEPVQFIVRGGSAPWDGFDLGCVQFGVRPGPEVAWTTRALASLVTREAFPIRDVISPYAWPFGGDTFIYNTLSPSIGDGRKHRTLARMQKYAARGYTFPEYDMRRTDMALALPGNKDLYPPLVGVAPSLLTIRRLRECWISPHDEASGTFYPMELSVAARHRWLDVLEHLCKSLSYV
jgi:hypothetical protein